MNPNEVLSLRQLRSEALKSAREAKGVNKFEMMERTGLSRTTINGIEKNSTGWGVDVEIIYMHALDLVAFQPVYGEENGKVVITKMILVPRK